jgi:hypothetical protein
MRLDNLADQGRPRTGVAGEPVKIVRSLRVVHPSRRCSPDRIRTGATALRGTKRSITRWPADLQLRCQPAVCCQDCGHASGTTHPGSRSRSRPSNRAGSAHRRRRPIPVPAEQLELLNAPRARHEQSLPLSAIIKTPPGRLPSHLEGLHALRLGCSLPPGTSISGEVAGTNLPLPLLATTGTSTRFRSGGRLVVIGDPV